MALSNPLTNITIDEDDVREYFPSIDDYLQEGETAFTHEITQAQCQFWDDLKNQFRYDKTDAELADLRDFELSSPITRKICYQVVANVLMNHGHPDESAIYQERANGIALTDLAFSADATVTDNEKTGEGLRQVSFSK